MKEVNINTNADIEATYEAMRVRDAGYAAGAEYACGCGEQHTVGDPACVVFFKHKPWHVDCLVDNLTDVMLDLEKILDHPQLLADAAANWEGIAPERSPNGIWWCSRDPACHGYSRLKNGEVFCVITQTSMTAAKPCMPWLIALIRVLRRGVQ